MRACEGTQEVGGGALPNTRHAIRRLPPRRPHAKRSGQWRRRGGMRALSDDGSAPPRARHARDLERGFGLVEVLADVGCTRGRRAAARQRVRTLPLVKRSDSTPPSQPLPFARVLPANGS